MDDGRAGRAHPARCDAIPFGRINGLMARTRVRAKDKSSAVRRRALQLASALLGRHPYRVGDGQLALSVIEASYAKVADELEVRARQAHGRIETLRSPAAGSAFSLGRTARASCRRC